MTWDGPVAPKPRAMSPVHRAPPPQVQRRTHQTHKTRHEARRQNQAGTATTVGREIDERSLSLSLVTGEEQDLAVPAVDNLDNMLISFVVEDVLVGTRSGTITDSMTE